MGKPVGQKVLAHVLGAVELLKTLSAAIDRKGSLVALTAMHAARACAAQIRRLLLPIKAKLEAARSASTHNAHASPLAAISPRMRAVLAPTMLALTTRSAAQC